MSRIFIISILILSCTLCACHRNIDDKHIEFEKATATSPVETTTEEVIEETERMTEEPTEQSDYMCLLQAAMLNKIKIHFNYEAEPVYLKEIFWAQNSYAFSVVDLSNNGQTDVVLYIDDKTNRRATLWVKNGKVYFQQSYGYYTCYDDGYIGYDTQWELSRIFFEPKINEWKLLFEIRYDENGNITSGEEYAGLISEFSTTPVPIYELTQENIMKYVK